MLSKDGENLLPEDGNFTDLIRQGSAVLARIRLRDDALLSALSSDGFRWRVRPPDLEGRLDGGGPPKRGSACAGLGGSASAMGVVVDGGPPAAM